ncbi:Protein mlp1 [Stygiomarasmius scandens]|uniref:Protein mlp1 n=1 Tax=Marasmiellus scandens TaxID=2682957 RepID=A0ABR1IT96_9AGAR
MQLSPSQVMEMWVLSLSIPLRDNSRGQLVLEPKTSLVSLPNRKLPILPKPNSLRRLVTTLEGGEKRAKEIIENLEREWDDLGRRHETKTKALREEADRKREKGKKKISQLKNVVEKMGRGDFHAETVLRLL